MDDQPISTKMSKIKKNLPQVGAAMVASSFSFCYGISLAYPAVLIAQLKKINNLTAVDDFVTITDKDASWIASIGNLGLFVITIFVMCIVDGFGRLNTIRLMVPVFILGQILMITSTNLGTLLAGRALSIGAAGSFIIMSSVYIAEISLPEIRGSLLNYKVVGISSGILLTYIKGKYLHWRLIASIVCGYAATFFVLSMCIPESSFWLASKNRIDQAMKSAHWFGTPEPVAARSNKRKFDWNAFRKPTFYKPLLVITGFYFFQDLSGSNVIFANLITFFNDFGTDYDPFSISIYMGLTKLSMNFINTWSMAKFGRRSLAMFSFLGIAVTLSISATFTMWVNDGSTKFQWVLPITLVAYVIVLNCGVMFMPYVISTEICPGSIRGTTQAISFCISCAITFCAHQLYYLIKRHCASWYIQYYFALIALCGFLYVYVFLPETHNKTLIEVEEYFWHHSNYISAEAAKKKEHRTALLAA